jgi:hypothetical protein
MNAKVRHSLNQLSILGLTLIVMVALLSWAAYYLYVKGVPGTPNIGFGLFNYSRIGVLMPHGSKAKTFVSYGSLGNTNGARAEIDIHVATRSDGVYGGLLLAGGAASDDIRVIPQYTPHSKIVRKVEGRVDFGAVGSVRLTFAEQLIFFWIPPQDMVRQSDGGYTGKVDFSAVMRQAAVERENERIAVKTPFLVGMQECALLDGALRAQILNPSVHSVNDAHCVTARDPHASIQEVELFLPSPAIRIDYINTQPLQQQGTLSGQLLWRSGNSINVQASIVLLSEEARGQHLLFLSGIAAGLAAGMVPLAVEVIFSRSRSRRRADEQ